MRTPSIAPAPAGRSLRLHVLLATLSLLLALAGVATTHAATVSERMKEMHCTSRPKQVEGTMLYKCETGSGTSYFSADGVSSGAPAGRSAPGNGAVAVPAPRGGNSAFPRVDAETQKGRDDVRRRVLQDELAAEEKLLTEARGAFADGAPPPLPEERTNADKYRERLARLRQSITLHERNVEALKKEIGGLR